MEFKPDKHTLLMLMLGTLMGMPARVAQRLRVATLRQWRTRQGLQQKMRREIHSFFQ